MIIWKIIALLFIVPAPLIFISGYYFGSWHLRKIAIEENEDKLPNTVEETIKKYRESEKYYLEEIDKIGDKK